jgi:hypothetical protein
MKKIIVLSMVVAICAILGVFATDVQTTLTEREIRDPVKLESILETNFGELDRSVNTIDTTAYIMQVTNVTMHSGTVWTQTWATVFGAAPTVAIVTPTELHAAVPFVSSITASNLLVTVEADKNFILVCIGKRP